MCSVLGQRMTGEAAHKSWKSQLGYVLFIGFCGVGCIWQVVVSSDITLDYLMTYSLF